MNEYRAYTFNKNPPIVGGAIVQPDDREIRSTPGLFNASLRDAFLYGGDLTRTALNAIKLHEDREYVIVDTKVHMLMPGMWPAIPGWHTDGAPRPDGYARLDLQEQELSPRFHLLVTGSGCLTDFVKQPVSISVPPAIKGSLYEHLSGQIEEIKPTIWEIPTCQVVEWGWWDLHRAKAATKREWRFLIRVTETNTRPPKTELRDVLRKQEQVYVPAEAFGW